MYIALRPLQLSSGKKAVVGEPLPEVLSWRENIIRSHLNLHWIKWVDDVSPQKTATKKKAPKGKKKEA